MGKYNSLRTFLENCAPDMKEITLSFSQIEIIIKEDLPDSSQNHRPWWANEVDGKHVQAASWLDAGWKVDDVDQLRKHVTFTRKR